MSFEIKFYLKNYKGLGVINPIELGFTGDVMLITGKNDAGKTSLIQSLHEAWTLKCTTPNPLTTGQEDGKKRLTVPDVDGNPITIVHDFDKDNKQGTFYAIDRTGKVIRNLPTIKGLLGTYAPLTVEMFFNDMKTTEGRRKLVKNYLLPLMGTSADRIMEINNSINEGKPLFKQRTEKSNILKSLQTIIGNKIPVTAEEKVYAANRATFAKAMEDLRVSQTSISQVISLTNLLIDQMNGDLPGLLKYEKTMPEMYKILHKTYSDFIDQRNEQLAHAKLDLDKIAPDLLRGESAIKACDDILTRMESEKTDMESLRVAQEEVTKISEQIETLKVERTNLLSKCTLPNGLTTDGESIQIDGFDFVEEQIGGARALLAIAEIMAQLFTGKIIVMGAITEFDSDSIKKIFELAHKYGKIVALTKVVDNSSVGVEAIIED